MSVRESIALPTNGRSGEAAPDAWVHRFGRTERFVHWWTVLMLAVAVISGFGMGDDGGSGPILMVHVGAVVLLAVGFAGALLFGDHRAVFAAVQRLFIFDRRDVAWVRVRVHNPFHPDADPAWGMFNTGQKLLAWALSTSVVLVIVTGVLSWSQGGEGGLHGAAVLLTGLLLSAHLFMAVVNPRTRHALHGMVFGRVSRAWAATHHRAWLDSLEQTSGRKAP